MAANGGRLNIFGQGGVTNGGDFNVVVNGMILAEDGQKLSKKLRNYPEPNEVFDELGADADELAAHRHDAALFGGHRDDAGVPRRRRRSTPRPRARPTGARRARRWPGRRGCPRRR